MKRRLLQGCAWSLILAVGYLWGRNDATALPSAIGQDVEAGPSSETQRKIQAANDALKVAMEGLKSESRYTLATRGMNVYAVLSGGIDAVADLETGRGVDPDTFAALYADQALDEIQQHLAKDGDGRLTYKNKLVRIYPITRLKRDQQRRMILTGEVPATATPAAE